MRLIGEFYREKVLSLDPAAVRERELPRMVDDVQIVKGLFGWEINSKKERIECRSEAEARYLKVMIDFGYHEVLVPVSDEYIKEFLPAIENIRNKSLRILEDILQTILNRKAREKIRSEIFAEITK